VVVVVAVAVAVADEEGGEALVEAPLSHPWA